MNARERFVAGPHRESHQKWATDAVGEVACETALLTLVESLPENIDPTRGWDNAMQLSGARKFKEILLELWKKEEPKKADKLAGSRLKPPE